MDLFTHVLLGYLLAFGVAGPNPTYLAAGALAGGLPDADILLFPLARRFPILRHHGITHSILGVTVVALVGGGLLAPRLAPGDPVVYVVVMELAGLGHVAADGFTHFSVPPLLPFSEARLELDADRAVNFVTLVVSIGAFYLLLAVERGRVPFPVYLLTVYGLMAFYAAYFALRLAARLWIGRRLRSYGPFDVPVPLTNPIDWLLLSEVRAAGRIRTTFALYRFGRGLVGPVRSIDVPIEPDGGTGPVTDAAAALARSYPIARRASGLLDQTYHFGEARSEADGAWSATWYSLEVSAFGRAFGVRVRLAPDGRATTRRAWTVPAYRRPTA
ncbi:MAG TPA: metal-dependent hydrolase [Thermoplasmata archaeon]|nr:metal-dependent hydrolase [Thermoplasmata archaeon]